ncbi:hypothetical protein Emag_004824 [Eimeria magna]
MAAVPEGGNAQRGAPDDGSSGVFKGPSGPTGATPSEVENENRLRVIPHVSPELIGKMAADVRKVPADERHPLVNHDPEDVEQALEAAVAGPHAHGKPAGRRWHGWRRGSGSRRQSNLQHSLPCPSDCVQQAIALPPSDSQSSSDEGLYRWWRLCGLEPKTVSFRHTPWVLRCFLELSRKRRQRRIALAAAQTREGSRHPREDVRFTSIILVTFFGLEIFVNFDCGAIPCTLSKMADEFRLSPTWQGMLGALPYVGLTLASPFAGRVFAQWRAKRVILYSMILNAAATLLMVLTVFLSSENVSTGIDDNAAESPAAALAVDNTPTLSSGVSGLFKDGEGGFGGGLKPFFHLPDFSFVDLTPSAILLLCSRLLVGFTQAPFVIYAPVWVDEFAPPKKAALWMGIMQGAAVVGVTVGYLCAGVLSVYLGLNWRSAIGIQVVFLCLLTAITAFFPRQFVETPGSPGSSERREACAGFPGVATIEGNEERERMQQRRESASGLREAFPSPSVVVELPMNDSERSPYRGASSSQQARAIGDVEEVCSPPSASETHKTRPENEHRSTSDAEGGEESGPSVLPVSRGHRRAALALMTTPMYVSPMLTLCALLFVVTGVQFWGTVFFASSLGLTPTVAMLAFAAVAATSPIAGVVMGGVTVDAVGGYKTLSGRKRTLYACTAYAAGAVAFAVIGSFSTSPYLCIASLWFLLCFGAAMLPPLTGVQIDAVAPPLRTLASGMSMFFYNILGYALGKSELNRIVYSRLVQLHILKRKHALFCQRTRAFLPGVVMDLFHGGDVLGLRLVLLWSFFGLFFVSLTAMYARRLERRGVSRVDLSSARQLSVLPSPVPIPSHSPKSSDISRRISGSQGFLPVPGEAAWRQQEHAD